MYDPFSLDSFNWYDITGFDNRIITSYVNWLGTLVLRFFLTSIHLQWVIKNKKALKLQGIRETFLYCSYKFQSLKSRTSTF